MILLDTGTPGTSRKIFSEDADDGSRSRSPLLINQALQPLSYTAQKAIAGKEFSLTSWCIVLLYICHFSTLIDFSSEKYSGSTGQRDF